MPSDFPGSPKLVKGALVVFETQLPIPTNLIVFQYNPETMSRDFQQLSGSGDPRDSAGDTQNIMLPPIESFHLTVELDAADQLEAPGSNPLAVAVGLHPDVIRIVAELLIDASHRTQLFVTTQL